MAIFINHFLGTYFFGAVETHRTYILFYTAMYFLFIQQEGYFPAANNYNVKSLCHFACLNRSLRRVLRAPGSMRP